MPKYKLRKIRPADPSSSFKYERYALWHVLVDGETIGQVDFDGLQWVALSYLPASPYEVNEHTRDETIDRFLELYQEHIPQPTVLHLPSSSSVGR